MLASEVPVLSPYNLPDTKEGEAVQRGVDWGENASLYPALAGVGAYGASRGGDLLEQHLRQAQTPKGAARRELLEQQEKLITERLGQNGVSVHRASYHDAHFDPAAKRVNLSNTDGLATLAHEAGHATKKMFPLQHGRWLLGMDHRLTYAPAALGVGAMMYKHQQSRDPGDAPVPGWVKGAAGVGAALPLVASAPVIAEEARANVNAYKILRQGGLGRMKALGTVAQLLPAFGTYALPPAAALGVYAAARKIMAKEDKVKARKERQIEGKVGLTPDHPLLDKLASRLASSMADMEKELQAGDVLLMSGKKPRNLFGSAYRQVAGLVTGDHKHSALYVGDGKIVDARVGAKVKLVPLVASAAKQDVWVVRPKVPESTRREAAERAKTMVGANYDSSATRFAKILFAQGSGPKRPVMDKIREGLYCTNLVTRAYPKVQWHPTKSPEYLRPSDLASSRKVGGVVRFQNPERWDPQNRKPQALPAKRS